MLLYPVHLVKDACILHERVFDERHTERMVSLDPVDWCSVVGHLMAALDTPPECIFHKFFIPRRVPVVVRESRCDVNCLTLVFESDSLIGYDIWWEFGWGRGDGGEIKRSRLGRELVNEQTWYRSPSYCPSDSLFSPLVSPPKFPQRHTDWLD